MWSRPAALSAVLIGRFQPPHRAHLALVRQALGLAAELVIVLGSARSARTVRNPLSDSERASLIRAMLEEEGIEWRRVRLEAVPDAFYNLPMWVRSVRQAVRDEHAVLVGFEKDASSFYLRLFPEWRAAPPEFVSDLNASGVREAMYRHDWETVAGAVTPGVLSRLRAFARTPEFTGVQRDAQATLALAAAGPIRTVGTLLVSEGQMLLRPRTDDPGRGLWAIPEAASAEAAMQTVLTGVPVLPDRLRQRLLNHPQRLPGLDWQTDAGLYRLPARSVQSPGPQPLTLQPGAEWQGLDAVYSQPERFFADHAQGVRALLEDWPR